MELPDLRAVITQPAQLPDVRLFFEGNLVGDLLFETQGQGGALPLLAFTLEQLFQQREGQWLTIQAYQRIGGVKGALVTHAEATYTALPSDAHRVLARALFLRLIEPGMTEQDTTRRRVILPEMELPDARETAILQETANRFVTARLLTTNQVRETIMIEVSHEALIREWTRLSGWLDEAREDIIQQHAISWDAMEWEYSDRTASRLYRGDELEEALAWSRRNTTSKQERAFLRASAARQRRSLLVVVVVLLLVFASSGIAGWLALHQAPRADYVTTTTDDNATGSLRWAIANAQSGDTITFDPGMTGQTFIMEQGDIHILQQQLTIEGPATGRITIREIGAGLIVDTPGSVTISGMVFQGSNAKNQPSLITNQGTLTLKKCMLSGNTTPSNGGGISNEGGAITIINSTISGNTASGGSGGGIYNNHGTITITNSTISGNTAFTNSGIPDFTSGGGIDNNGTITIANSTISGNTAPDGGGIDNSGTTTITNSTISGNTASSSIGFGGGIDNGFGGTLTMNNSTISGNTASTGGGIIYSASGVPSVISDTMGSETMTITNSTISGNTARTGSGGGINNTSINGTITMNNSTISGNTASTGGGIYSEGISDGPNNFFNTSTTLIFCTIVNNSASGADGFDIEDYNRDTSHISLKASIVGGSDIQHNPIAGLITSEGYNVIQQMSSTDFVSNAAHATDRSVQDLTGVLGPSPRLQKNGGPTLTYQLVSGASNPAVNDVPLAACTDAQGRRIVSDQRGMPRPGRQKRFCDSGAYASQGASAS